MKNKLHILFILTTTILCGQNGRFQPLKDSQVIIDTLHPLTFNQKLNNFTKYDSKNIYLKYSNLDTNSYKLSIDLTFLFYKKAIKVLLADLCSDTALAKLNNSNIFSIKSNELVLVNNSKMNCLYTESGISINSINGIIINKNLPILINLTVGNESPTLDIYIEISPQHWYYFYYSKNVMYSVSSNLEYNSILKSKSLLKESYSYMLCAPVKRDAFLRKQRQRNETTRH